MHVAKGNVDAINIYEETVFHEFGLFLKIRLVKKQALGLSAHLSLMSALRGY